MLLSQPLVLVRGTILGKTQRSIDIQIGTGFARRDQRLEMPDRVRILVANRARLATIHTNAAVLTILAAPSRTRARLLVVARDTSRATLERDDLALVFRARSDVTLGTLSFLPGHRDRSVIAVAGYREPRRIDVPRDTPVVTLEPGSISDLIGERHVAIVASDSGLSAENVARTIIVDAGARALLF